VDHEAIKLTRILIKCPSIGRPSQRQEIVLGRLCPACKSLLTSVYVHAPRPQHEASDPRRCVRVVDGDAVVGPETMSLDISYVVLFFDCTA
jgi:hypothetical protein